MLVQHALCPLNGVEGRLIFLRRCRTSGMPGHVIFEIEHQVLARTSSNHVIGIESVGAHAFEALLPGITVLSGVKESKCLEMELSSREDSTAASGSSESKVSIEVVVVSLSS